MNIITGIFPKSKGGEKMARSTKFTITITESTEESVEYKFSKFMDLFVEPLVNDLIENHLEELIIKKRPKTDEFSSKSIGTTLKV